MCADGRAHPAAREHVVGKANCIHTARGAASPRRWGVGEGRDTSEGSKVLLGHLFVWFYSVLLLLIVVDPKSGLEPAG